MPFTAFTGRRKAEHVACRLVVRRVKRLQPLASDGSEQGELFATYRHHGFITNSTLGVVEADQRHHDHAIIEQVIAELKDNALAHLPSGKYAANAAWVAHAVIAVQHRPRRSGRHRSTPCTLGDPADPDHQCARPDRIHRPPPRAAPTHPLAPGHQLAITVDNSDRDRATRRRRDLTTQPATARPEDQNGEAGTGRKTLHARNTTPATIRQNY